MTLHFGKTEREQFATFWEITEDKGTYAIVSISTSEYNKKEEAYENSNWKFARFVGDAYEGLESLDKGTRITIHGTVDNKPYMKDGEKTYPKNPKITVFHWEIPDPLPESSAPSSAKTSSKKKEVVQPDDDDDQIPF
jgi:single-stranded DNA-binding protein